MFKIGDLAVYPAHGVGVVQSIEAKEILGSKTMFYILRILENGMTIMVPTDNIEGVGLRGIIPQKKVTEVYEILKDKKSDIDYQTWNRRHREYSDKIKSGSLFEVAEVLRDLTLLKMEKELSFGERRMLDTAKNLLIQEVAIAKRTKTAKIEEEIKTIFKHVA